MIARALHFAGEPFSRCRGSRRCGILGVALAVVAAQVVKGDQAFDVPTDEGSGITLNISTPLTIIPHFGFMPVHFAVDNKSGRDGRWRVTVRTGEEAVFPGASDSSFELAAPAGTSRETWAFIPIAAPGVIATPMIRPGSYMTLATTPPAPFPAPTAGALEADAARVLKPTHLLDIPWGVTESLSISGTLLTYEQTGSAWALERPPAGSLPRGVVVTIHPSLQSDEVVRVITYVDPLNLEAQSAQPASRADAYRMAVVRNETALRRYGFLRKNASIEASQPYSFGDTDGVVTTTYTESGPSDILPLVPADSLPPDTLVSVSPGPIPPGGVIRKVTVTTHVPTVAADPGIAIPYSSVLGAMDSGIILAEISGTGLAIPGHVDLSAGLDGGILPMPPIAVSPKEADALRSRLAHGNLRSAPAVSPMDPALLPADWRVWSSFHGVFMGESEYRGLDAGHRDALRRWVAFGGLLVLASESETGARVERLGVGTINTLNGPFDFLPPRNASSDFRLSSPSPSLPSRDLLSRDYASVERLGSASRTEVRWLIIFLVAFGILAGPVNGYVFARAERRHRVFATTTIITAAGAAALGGLILVWDGLGGTGERTTLVDLVPEAGGAVVFQDQVSQTGLVAFRHFSMPDDVALTAVPVDARGMATGGTVRSREAGTASGDWFRNRDYQAYHLRRFVSSPGQLELIGSDPGGAPIVASTLKVPLTSFVLVDAQERIWAADSIKPGEKATLTPAADATWPPHRLLGSAELTAILEAGATRQPGRWMAFAGPSEIAPIATLASIRWKSSEILYSGIAAAPTRVAALKGGVP